MTVEACDQTRKQDFCCRRLTPPLPRIGDTRATYASTIASASAVAVIVAAAASSIIITVEGIIDREIQRAHL